MNDIEKIEQSIKLAEEAISLWNSFVKLSKNKEFIKIIYEGYFKEELNRVTFSRPSANLEGQSKLDDVFKSIGLLNTYFSVLKRNNDQAIVDIEKLNEDLENLRKTEE